MSAGGSRPSEARASDAIVRARIPRFSPAKVEAWRRREQAITAFRAAKRTAKVMTVIARRAGAVTSQAPQAAVSEILNIFRHEYEALTEPEQFQFESAVKQYVLGRMPGSEWTCVVRSIRASYQATLPPEPRPGERRSKAKDRTEPPQGW